MDRLIHNGDGTFSVESPTGRKMDLQLGMLTCVPDWLRSYRLCEESLVLYAMQIKPNVTRLSTSDSKSGAYGYASWTFCLLGHLDCSNLCHILTSELLPVLSVRLGHFPLAVSTPSRDLSLIADLIRQSRFRRIKLPLTCLLRVPGSLDELFCRQLAVPCSPEDQTWEPTADALLSELARGGGSRA